MLKYLAAYGGAAIAFVILDAFWLTLVAPKIYRPIQNVLLSGQVKPVPAVLFYLLFLAGLVFLAIRPAMASGRWTDALTYGAAFGFVSYATYALTNHAVMRGWGWTMTLSDMGWGAVAAGAGAVAGFYAAGLVGK